MKSPGQLAYEAEVAAFPFWRPVYGGGRRRTWEEADTLVRLSWEKYPVVRDPAFLARAFVPAAECGDLSPSPSVGETGAECPSGGLHLPEEFTDRGGRRRMECRKCRALLGEESA